MNVPVPWRAAPAHAAALSTWLADRPLWQQAALRRALHSGRVQVWCVGEGPAWGAMWINVSGDFVDVCDVFVAPLHRKKGAGLALIRQAMATARQLQASGVTLEVAVDNAAAIALYVRCAFVTVGLRKGYYEGPNGRTDAYVMSWRCAPTAP